MNKRHMTILQSPPLSKWLPDDTWVTPKLFKTFDVEDGELKVNGYDMVYIVETVKHEFNDLNDIAEALEVISSSNSAIVRGSKKDGLPKFTRRLLHPKKDAQPTFDDNPISWLGIDVDGVAFDDIDDNSYYLTVEAIDRYIAERLPTEFLNVGYCYHFSGSAGISCNGISAKDGLVVHLFFLLDKEVDSKQTKTWLKPLIDSKDVDGSHYSPIQFLYCCPAQLNDDSITDYFTVNSVEKIGIVNKEHEEVVVPEIKEPVADIRPVWTESELNDRQKSEILNELAAISNVDYNVWRDIGWAMNCNGFSYNDYVALTISLRAHRLNNATESVWRDGNSKDTSLGVLINIIKQHNPTFRTGKTKDEKRELMKQRLRIKK